MRGAARRALAKASARPRPTGLQAVLTGILPTLRKTDLGIDNMVPNPRYLTLNRAMTAPARRGLRLLDQGARRADRRGTTRSCSRRATRASRCTCRSTPERFARRLQHRAGSSGPALALGDELAAAVRQAAVGRDAHRALRAVGRHPHARSARARREARVIVRQALGQEGRRSSIFSEDVTRFRSLRGAPTTTTTRWRRSSAARVPELKALRLHNGTIYRWNRACYGISEEAASRTSASRTACCRRARRSSTRSRTPRSGSG